MSVTERAPVVDTRAPRFIGGYTFVIAVVCLLIALVRPLDAAAADRVTSPEFLLLGLLWLSFGAGTFFGNGAHPFAPVYRALIRPRLYGRPEFEDARPPRFALLVGFVLSTLGLVLHVAGVPFGLVTAVAFIVVASFLQAFVGFCLGCWMYLLLVRAGAIRAARRSA
jgi:hypothetical protein